MKSIIQKNNPLFLYILSLLYLYEFNNCKSILKDKPNEEKAYNSIIYSTKYPDSYLSKNSAKINDFENDKIVFK